MDLKDLKKKDISTVRNNVDNTTYLLLEKKREGERLRYCN